MRRRRDVQAEFMAAQSGNLGDVDEATQKVFLEVLLDIRHLVNKIYEKLFISGREERFKDGNEPKGEGY
jgi:hypothetical protein